MVFGKATMITLFFLIAGCLILTWQLVDIKETDKKNYQALALASNLTMDPTLEPYSARQDRAKIVKEFFINGDKHERKIVRIKCSHSSLCYEQMVKKKAIVEKMNNVSCLIREALFVVLKDGRKAFKQENGQFLIQDEDPMQDSSWLVDDGHLNLMQTVQCIYSTDAVYHYQTQQLEAKNVTIERYLIPGPNLPSHFNTFKPIFSSNAEKAIFTFGQQLQFKATNVKASYFQ
ncbi:MAG: hypothetical protein ACSNEK_01995 [Parachlamydiaceae bacterium]